MMTSTPLPLTRRLENCVRDNYINKNKRGTLLKLFYSSNHIYDILTSSTDIIQLVVLAVVAPLRPLQKNTD